MPEAGSLPQTYTLSGVEIFASGTWSNEEYSNKDLDDMVSAFPHVGFKPPIKLGHSEDQRLLKESGLPAAGWVERIYRNGKKLLADIKDIPKQVYELIQKHAYDKPSVEIYWDYEDTPNNRKWPRVLKAVALLGAEIPEVTTLRSISEQYYDNTGRAYKTVVFTEDVQMAEHSVKFVIGRPEGKTTTEVQTVIFPKEDYTLASAKAWLKEHDLKVPEVDETEDSYRFRQRDPGDFQAGSFRTISPGEGQSKEEEKMAEKEMEVTTRLKQTETDLAEVNKKLTEMEKADEARKVELKASTDRVKTLEETLTKEREIRRTEQISQKVGTFIKAKKITPAQGLFYESWLKTLPPEQEITVMFSKDGVPAPEKFSSEKLFERIMDLQSQFIGEEKTQQGIEAGDTDAHVRAYCTAQNLDYSKSADYKRALMAVQKGKPVPVENPGKEE